jgi:hypothetical protein
VINEINSASSGVNAKANEASASATTATTKADKATQEADRAEAAANSITVNNGDLQRRMFKYATEDNQSTFDVPNSNVIDITLGGLIVPLFDSRTDTTITIKTDVIDIKVGDELGFLVIT